MGIRPSKETLISREIDSHNRKRAVTRTPVLLCLGEPLPPVCSSLACDFVYIKQQRSQKWLQLLATAEDTTQAIVFTVPLIWYEESIKDSDSFTRGNKLQQAMEYFRVIRKHLRNRSIIVILTHRPEFAARIRGGEVDLVDQFPHYQGPPEDPAAALHFVRNEFKRLFYESSKASWANLFLLYDDGCKQLRSTFLAQAVDAIRKTDSFAHIEDMLTPCHGVKVSSTVKPANSMKRREETQTVRLSSHESSSELTDRI
ncbi:hypothetical protein FisN_32Hh064 [Fistulifera solaris]|uniref:Uncharacterized protein n=1 Tax=Fistulifera solaris TaxID=1519565 RepID=A0A1Z5K367_FISSO|nr:hypothetical protein FisN_32Hh064 [Fistulifera solaris]|eukprot:GAX20675.1 hypothetical protein FisN_32Hh064 [Fistulifera solaris]